MSPSIKAELDKEEVSPFHKEILDSTLDLVKLSRSAMSNFYSDWDTAAMTYRCERYPDKEDEKANEKGEPEKMVVPLGFAQVQTFIAFGFLLLTQNQNFYELSPTGDEDFKIRDDCEKFLRRDLDRNQWPVTLYQLLLDAARFNLGVVKSRWEECYQYVPREISKPPTKFLGITVRPGHIETVTEKILKSQGNELLSVSPYRWFPDTRLPLARFQKGEFCASEDEVSLTELRKLEAYGEVAGVDHIKALIEDESSAYSPSGRRTGSDDSRLSRFSSGLKWNGKDRQTCGTVVLTECQRWIIPRDFEVAGETPLSDESYPVLYNIQIANDQRVVKCEPMGYLHDQFTYDMIQFSPDMHRTLGPSLSGVMDKLQELVSWFLNSHVVSVRQTIKGKFLVDPTGVSTKDIDSKSPYILTKKSVALTGVDKWMKQLDVKDVTAGHMADADIAAKLVQVVTGVNDNAMGQYNSGRRSATEARAVTSGAAARLKTIISVMWSMGFNPLGRKMLSNLRQGINEITWARVIGKPPIPQMVPMVDPMTQQPMLDQMGMPAMMEDASQLQAYLERYMLFKSTPEELVGQDDFFVFDGTLPSEKGFIAQSLQEFAQAAMASPETLMALQQQGITIPSLLTESLRLRGVTNLSRFSNQPSGVPGLGGTSPVATPPIQTQPPQQQPQLEEQPTPNEGTP